MTAWIFGSCAFHYDVRTGRQWVIHAGGKRGPKETADLTDSVIYYDLTYFPLGSWRNLPNLPGIYEQMAGSSITLPTFTESVQVIIAPFVDGVERADVCVEFDSVTSSFVPCHRYTGLADFRVSKCPRNQK